MSRQEVMFYAVIMLVDGYAEEKTVMKSREEARISAMTGQCCYSRHLVMVMVAKKPLYEY